MSLALIGAEVVLRLFTHNSYAGAAPDPIHKLRLQNGHRDYIADRRELNADIPQVRFRTDTRSYILPSFQYEKPDATIAFLGGSTTECVAVQEQLRFHALTSELLAKKGLKVNTLNSAKSGNTMHDSVNILLNHVVRDKPDFAVVMNVTNDIGVLEADLDYQSRMSRQPSWRDSVAWAIQLVSGHSAIFGALRHAFADSGARQKDPSELKWRNEPARAERLPIDLYEHRLRSFISVCRSFGIEPVLMTEPLIYSTSKFSLDWANMGAQDRFNSLILKVAEEEHVPVINLVKHLQDSVPNWDKEMVVFYDGTHVTDAGSTIYAEYIAEQLEPLVRKHLAEREAAPAQASP